MPPPEEENRRRRSDDPEALLTSDPPIAAITQDVGQSIRNTLRVLIGATVVLYVIMFGFMGWTWNVARNTNEALCAVRSNAEVQRDSAKQFLKEHPAGFPGITAEQLQASVSN